MTLENIRNDIINRLELNPDKYFSKETLYYLYLKMKKGDINISDVYSCLNELDCFLYVNDFKADSKEMFGELLRKNRRQLNITRLNLLTEKNISFTIINKIESGKNCKKNNLENYLKAFPNLKIDIK